jgi:hypothetical protein
MQDLDPKATKRGQVILQKPVCQPSTSLNTFAVTPFPEFLVAASVFVSPRHRHVTPHLIHPPSICCPSRPATAAIHGERGRRAPVHCCRGWAIWASRRRSWKRTLSNRDRHFLWRRWGPRLPTHSRWTSIQITARARRHGPISRPTAAGRVWCPPFCYVVYYYLIHTMSTEEAL